MCILLGVIAEPEWEKARKSAQVLVDCRNVDKIAGGQVSLLCDVVVPVFTINEKKNVFVLAFSVIVNI